MLRRIGALHWGGSKAFRVLGNEGVLNAVRLLGLRLVQTDGS